MILLACSGTIDKICKKLKPLVSDGIIARDFKPEALEILRKKKRGNLLYYNIIH